MLYSSYDLFMIKMIEKDINDDKHPQKTTYTHYWSDFWYR